MPREAAVQIVITLTPDGRFNCEGPLHNKLLCYGLLELAKEAVSKNNPPKIHRPSADIVQAFRG